MIWFLVGVGALILLGWRLVWLVLTDGYGDRPGPRSHHHEGVGPWRAGA